MANVQSATNGKAPKAPTKVADATKAKAKKAEPKYELATVNAAALSTDVGPRVLSMFMGIDRGLAQAKQLRADAESRGNEMLALLTDGIKHAAENDESIDLTAYFKPDKEARADVNHLGEQLRIALGIQEVVEVSTGTKKLVETAAVAKLWGKMDKNQKTNFATMIKKCGQAAAALIDGGIDTQYDEENKTLLIEGPEVKKHFGQSQVLLNSKQTIKDGDKEITLGKKPSYQALADIAKLTHGVVPVKRDARPAPITGKGLDYTKDGAFTQLAKTVVDTIAKIGNKPSAAIVTALKAIQSAVNQALPKPAKA